MWGSEFIVGHSLAPCALCGRLTYFIDIFSEERICSEKCSKISAQRLWRAEKEYFENEQRNSWEKGCTSEEWYEFLIGLDSKF